MITSILVATAIFTADLDGLTVEQSVFLARMEVERDVLIKELAVEARQLKRQLKTLSREGTNYIRARDRAILVRNALVSLKRNKKKGVPYVPVIENVDVGAFGRIIESLSVRQVVGDGELIVEFPDESLAWISGVRTKRLVDDDRLNVENLVFEVKKPRPTQRL